MRVGAVQADRERAKTDAGGEEHGRQRGH